jgi:hypothetical protein
MDDNLPDIIRGDLAKFTCPELDADLLMFRKTLVVLFNLEHQFDEFAIQVVPRRV